MTRRGATCFLLAGVTIVACGIGCRPAQRAAQGPKAVAAQAAAEIGAPEVSEARVVQTVTPKTTSPQGMRALRAAARAAAPLRAWRSGDQVRVRGDMIEQRGLAAAAAAPPPEPDELLTTSRTAAPTVVKPVKVVSFEGIPATGVLPPDVVGAVGPKHFIQMVNSAFVIFDKTGNRLAGPSNINTLWTGFGGPCEAENAGDPIVRYDHLADRWLISQFALDDHMQCIAISQGPDPVNDGWFLYAFNTVMSNGVAVDGDYPKISVWPDGYYMGTQRGFPSGGLDVWAFEREKMLAGQPARQVEFAVKPPSLFLLPSDLDGPPPAPGAPNFFVRAVDGERFGGKDRIEVFAFSVNWATPSASTFKLHSSVPTAKFDSVLCDTGLLAACVPQPGTAQRLETLTVWPMWRAQYRNFGSHETLMFDHTVDATGTDIAGVRWYELDREGSGTWKMKQQGTHAPDDGVHRWMGSVAMDAKGNIAAGYSASSTSVFPGIRVAIRRPSDPPGTLQGEVTFQKGAGSQTHPAARWGNYSSMDVDPVKPCTFWYTAEYFPAPTSQAGWKTRIIAFRIPNCPS